MCSRGDSAPKGGMTARHTRSPYLTGPVRRAVLATRRASRLALSGREVSAAGTQDVGAGADPDDDAVVVEHGEVLDFFVDDALRAR